MSQQSVAPGLLLAMPQMLDPNFCRAVVLMVDHGEMGSFGLIINRPLDARVSGAMGQLGLPWNGDPDAVVFLGGPVETGSGWLLHEPLGEIGAKETLNFAPDLAVSTSRDVFSSVANDPPERVRLLLGYAGWGSGQLERELSEGAWVLTDVSADFVFSTPPEEMWEAALRRLHVDPASLVPAGGVH